ncbi:MAG: hypothetical protein FWC09_09085, partial [Lachnospiraceae bacterium]|nr:hypothetical protein [Lachnospiraceae bacterium]
AHVAAVVDISFSGEIPAGGAKIPVTVNNANVGDYVYIVHRNSVTGTWEVVGQGVLGADMTIVGTFLNFSPVMIMVVPAADFAAAGVRAPRTGEF